MSQAQVYDLNGNLLNSDEINERRQTEWSREELMEIIERNNLQLARIIENVKTLKRMKGIL